MNPIFTPIFDQFFGGLVRGYDLAEPESDKPGSDDCNQEGADASDQPWPPHERGCPVG
jgi:hypothetical protein